LIPVVHQLHRLVLQDADLAILTLHPRPVDAPDVGVLIKKVKRTGHGFHNYRLRLLLHCGVTCPPQPRASGAAVHA